MSVACDDEGTRRAPEGRPAGEAWPPPISGQAIADEGKTDMSRRSFANGNGASTYNGPQAGPRPDWELAEVRASATTFWGLI